MRPLALILLLASCGLAHGQEQERKLVDRIMTPDMTLSYSMQGKAFYGGQTGSVDLSKDANVKDFYFTQKFTAKDFNAKAFDTKDFLLGDFKFATKAAPVKAHPDSDKTHETKAVPVKDASESGKGYMADSTYATRESPMKGKTSQNHLEEENGHTGAPSMNIDQVRELLNKPPLK